MDDTAEDAIGSGDADFDRACQFLLKSRAKYEQEAGAGRSWKEGVQCSVHAAGCWPAWVAYAFSTTPPGGESLPWAAQFASPTGNVISAYLLTIIAGLLISGVVYVLGRGDDGYTSGCAGFHIPGLLRRLVSSVSLGAGAQKRRTVPLAAAPLTPYSGGCDGSTGDGGAAGGAQPATTTTTTSATSITLGRSLLVVSARDEYVAIPVLRLDEESGTSCVQLVTSDGTEGNAATLGRDYGTIRVADASEARAAVKDKGEEAAASAITVSTATSEATPATAAAAEPPTRTAVVEFPPGSRLQFCYIDLMASSRRVTGEHDCAEFAVAIYATPAAGPGGGASSIPGGGGAPTWSTPALGPVRMCLVRIIKPDAFPQLPPEIGAAGILNLDPTSPSTDNRALADPDESTVAFAAWEGVKTVTWVPQGSSSHTVPARTCHHAALG